MAVQTKVSFKTDAKPWWCPGCGDFAVLAALQRAATQLGLRPENVVLVAGIGCSGKIGDYFGSYNIHVLHGRTMPVAQGIKLANRNLTVIAASGDGDGYGIGLNHFIHAVRRNIDLTYIVMDNHIYGLTKGQYSPTSEKKFRTVTSPTGVYEQPIQPLVLALAAGATFVAQGFSSNVNQLTDLIMKAIRHKGFSLVNVLSPCVTFNKVNTYDFFRANLVDVGDGEGYDPHDREAAMRRITETGGLVTGLLFEEEGPSFQDYIPGYPETPLTEAKIDLPTSEWDKILEEHFG